MKLKKSSKIYLLLWVGVIVSFVLLVVAARSGLFSPHHRLAQDPTNIEKITKIDLPDIASVESWNNLERGSSRWDLFEHRFYFSEKLSDECIHQLKSNAKQTVFIGTKSVRQVVMNILMMHGIEATSIVLVVVYTKITHTSNIMLMS